MNDENNIFSDFLSSNRSIGALNRDTERQIAEMGRAGKLALVDLRTVPRDEWGKWADFDVVVPPDVAFYIKERVTANFEGFSPGEVECMAAAVSQFHGLTDPDGPFFIEVSPTLRSTGRSWAFVPEVAPYLSGFTLARNE